MKLSTRNMAWTAGIATGLMFSAAAVMGQDTPDNDVPVVELPQLPELPDEAADAARVALARAFDEAEVALALARRAKALQGAEARDDALNLAGQELPQLPAIPEDVLDRLDDIADDAINNTRDILDNLPGAP